MRLGIVMPTFNQAAWLDAAIASVLGQKGAPAFELVVVNDASTDATAKILSAREGLRVVTHERNLGTAAAINTGVDALGPDFDALTWVSSDNVMAATWLERLSAEIERGAAATYGGFTIRRPGRRDSYFFRKHTADGLENDPNCYYGPALLIRRDVWIEAGPHRGRLAHDYDHWLRVEEVCAPCGLPIVGVDAPLCLYNAHDQRRSIGAPAHEFDAAHWQSEAKARRAALSAAKGAVT